ncbi:50S ribosomal protein L29 [bacterium]|nr:50S ribosomal protein L29 [bacterium]
MKIGEFHGLSDMELDKRLEELKGQLFQLRVNLRTGQLENTNKIRQTRRDIARALLVQCERRRGGGEARP